jgi:predicted 3-demethylubiquinone-9 3-methyltransferase (glyoxalase superfamily)
MDGLLDAADRQHGDNNVKPKNTICLWFDKDAHEAARFYAATFPESAVTAVHKAPSDYPSGRQGDVLTVEFTVLGIPCLGLNGGPAFKHSEAFSFQIATNNQEETDRYWNAIAPARKARAAGARTAGACPGRSRRAPSPTPWQLAAARPNARSRR